MFIENIKKNMARFIKTYSDTNAYEADKTFMEAPHVGYIEATDEVKYINDMADLYDIYGTVTTDAANYPFITFNVGGNNPVSYLGSGEFGFAFAITQSFRTIQFFDNVGISGGMNKFLTIDKIGYDLSNFTSISFNGCNRLTSINLKGVDTSSVTSMYYMFADCEKLTSLDVSNFNTSLVTNMHGMFIHCNGLNSLDVSNFNTERVTNMDNMFRDCNIMTSLDISNFSTSSVTNMNLMFYQCPLLSTVTMNNTNTTTFDMIKTQLVSDSVASHVTIIRDGHSYQYQNGQWVEA